MKNCNRGDNIIGITMFFCLLSVHSFAACLYIHKMLTGTASIFALVALIALVAAALLILTFITKKYSTQSKKTNPEPFWAIVFVSGLWGFFNKILYDKADFISKTATDKHSAVLQLIILFATHFIIIIAVIKIIDILYKKFKSNIPD